MSGRVPQRVVPRDFALFRLLGGVTVLSWVAHPLWVWLNTGDARFRLKSYWYDGWVAQFALLSFTMLGVVMILPSLQAIWESRR